MSCMFHDGEGSIGKDVELEDILSGASGRQQGGRKGIVVLMMEREELKCGSDEGYGK